MDEEQAAETEAEETREEESGNAEEENEAQEQQQEVEEHDWGEVERLREEFDAMQGELSELKEAFATLSVGAEQTESEAEPEDFGEDGEALDLDELEQMLGQ